MKPDIQELARLIVTYKPSPDAYPLTRIALDRMTKEQLIDTVLALTIAIKTESGDSSSSH